MKLIIICISLFSLSACVTSDFVGTKRKSLLYNELKYAETYNYSPSDIDKSSQSIMYGVIDRVFKDFISTMEGGQDMDILIDYLINSIYGSSKANPWSFNRPLPQDVVTLPEYNFIYATVLLKSELPALAKKASDSQLRGIMSHAFFAAARYDLIARIDAARCEDSATVVSHVVSRSAQLSESIYNNALPYYYGDKQQLLPKLIEGAMYAALQYEQALPPRKPNTLICLAGMDKSAALTPQNNWETLRAKQISDFKERYNMLISTYKSGEF